MNLARPCSRDAYTTGPKYKEPREVPHVPTVWRTPREGPRCPAPNACRVGALTSAKGEFERCGIQGAQLRADREKEGSVLPGFGKGSAGEPVVQDPAEGLPKTSLRGVYWTQCEKLV